MVVIDRRRSFALRIARPIQRLQTEWTDTLLPLEHRVPLLHRQFIDRYEMRTSRYFRSSDGCVYSTAARFGASS